MHLQAEELVDLAEGARPESASPHLHACAQCRAQLADLRAMMTAVAEVDAPEPSPLFWDHFSQRVHDAVAADRAPARRGWRAAILDVLSNRASIGSAAAIAVAAIVLIAVVRVFAPPHAPESSSAVLPTVGQPAPPEYLNDVAVDSDPSLTLVANLTSTLDVEARAETGLSRVGSADHALTHMNGAELRELHRLLEEEMAP